MSGHAAQVQDAPPYGAERRGAPIFAFVRAVKGEIYERGIIQRPDLVIVADDCLAPVPAAGVLQGADSHTVMLLNTGYSAETWRRRLNFPGTLLTLPAEAAERAELRFVGATCAGAATRLLGVIPRDALEAAIRQGLGHHGDQVLQHNLKHAIAAFDRMAGHTGCIEEGRTSGPDSLPTSR